MQDLQVPYVDGTEREIEGARLLEWLDSVEPRARTETYPLYLLTKGAYVTDIGPKPKSLNPTP